jgi:hypothetical protein
MTSGEPRAISSDLLAHVVGGGRGTQVQDRYYVGDQVVVKMYTPRLGIQLGYPGVMRTPDGRWHKLDIGD